VVTTDKASGKVLQVNAFDGSNAYSSDNLQDNQQGDVPLTVYRNPQDQNSLYLRKFTNGTDWKLNPAQDEESKFMFEKMRSDPQVELLDQETWDNTCTAPNAVRGKCGHSVYVLRSQQEIKLMVDNEITHPMGWVTFYFDTETYQLLGDRVTLERDGQEVLISSRRLVLDEILQADSNIAWDLSDLQGLKVVDDPNREHNRFGKLYQNIISVEDLASKTDSAYLLATVPEGFSLEVGVTPEQSENEQFFYEANYTSQAGDSFIIRALGKPLEDALKEDETYTTASGLVLHFIGQAGDTPKGEQVPVVLIEAPSGKTYAIESTLPRERVKELAEQLLLVR
jgi:hypothetical protein